MAPEIALLVGIAVGAGLIALPALRYLMVLEKTHLQSSQNAIQRAVVLQTRISELENRLLAHTWGEYAQLQTNVPDHTDKAVSALNSFGGSRPDEAHGESEQDLIDRYFQQSGADVEGPTIG